jgi:hypothetical protein
MDRTLLSRAVNFLRDQKSTGMESVNTEVLAPRYGEDILAQAIAITGMRLIRRASTWWILTDAIPKPYRSVGKE